MLLNWTFTSALTRSCVQELLCAGLACALEGENTRTCTDISDADVTAGCGQDLTSGFPVSANVSGSVRSIGLFYVDGTATNACQTDPDCVVSGLGFGCALGQCVQLAPDTPSCETEAACFPADATIVLEVS